MNGMRVFSVAFVSFAGLMLVAPSAHAADAQACKVGQGDQGETWRRNCRAAVTAARTPRAKSDMMFALAYEAIERQAPDEALTILNEAIRIDASNVVVRHERAYVLGEHGRYREALADLDFAIKTDPERSGGYAERAWARFMVGDFAGSLADREAGLRFAPRDPAAREARAGVLLWLGRFDEALADARAASDLATKGGDRDTMAALTRFPEAVRLWQARVSSSPAATACRAAATSGKYDAPGLFGDCSQAFLAAKASKERAEMLAVRAQARRFLSDSDSIDPVDMQIAAALDPVNPQWRLDLGNHYLAAQHSWAARNEFSQALSLDPRHAAALAGRAQANFNLGRVDDARSDALASLAVTPGSRANIILGEIAMQKNDKATARTHWLAAWKLGAHDAPLRAKLAGIGVANPDAAR